MNIIRYGGPMARTRKVGSPIGYSSSAAGLTGFVSVWATTAINETITIPCQNIGTFNAVVDWGDGSSETITAYDGFSHVYADIDDYTISITGTFPNIYLNAGASAPKLKKVLNLGTVGWTRLDNAFYGCTNLTEFTVGSTDTSSVTNMSAMFINCNGLTILDLSSFDVSSVNTMSYMFLGCGTLTSLDVSSFVTTSVTNMRNMFQGCNALTSLDVTSFVTTSVGNMSSMFVSCTGLISLDVSSFSTGNVTDMSLMFQGCAALTSIVGVEDLDITGLNSIGDLNNFLTVGKMTTAQYDALLVKWEAQASGIPAMTASFGASKYTGGGAAATARQDLIDIDGWSISDGGIAP